jgi:hypothetical protein
MSVPRKFLARPCHEKLYLLVQGLNRQLASVKR